MCLRSSENDMLDLPAPVVLSACSRAWRVWKCSVYAADAVENDMFGHAALCCTVPTT